MYMHMKRLPSVLRMRRLSNKTLINSLGIIGAAVALSAAAQDLSQNAAIHYMKACASILQPATPTQLEWVSFIENDLPQFAPRVFLVQPEALRWLAAEQSMLTSLAAGARTPACAFPLYLDDSPFPDRTHHALLRQLVQRALAVAKAYEYADNSTGAGAIYADLLRLVQHLAAEHTLYALMAAGELLQSIVGELEGFVAHEPPREALAEILKVFDDARENLFRPAPALREERTRISLWLLANPAQAAARLDPLYGSSKNRPAVERLLTLDTPAREARLREWLKIYGDWTEELAMATELPYAEAIERITRLDTRRKRWLRDPAGGDCPLVALLIPEFTLLYQRTLLAEAQFDVADLMSVAAMYRAETRMWPDTTRAMQSLVRYRSLPKDPFSDKPFYYRLERNMPRITVQVPRWMARDPKYYYDFALAERLERDQRRSEAYIRNFQRKMLRSALEQVPAR